MISLKDKPHSPSTRDACKRIAAEQDLSVDVVRGVVDAYVEKIVQCLEQEVPFSVYGLGKFYFLYRKCTPMLSTTRNPKAFEGKVHRELNFQIASTVKHRLQGWVSDLGMKTNLSRKELLSLKIRPDEIAKTRRAHILRDQREMGFNAELLFDEDDVTEADKAAPHAKNSDPSIEELLDRIGINIDLKK